MEGSFEQLDDDDYFRESGHSLPRIPSAVDAVDYEPSGGAVPSPDDEVSESATRISGSIWYTFTIVSVFIGFMLHGETPRWVLGVVAAEAYASLRRLVMLTAAPRGRRVKSAPVPHRRFRHFTSARLRAGAPVDELVAAFVSLDEMRCVRSIELGSNFNVENKSRGHSLGFLVTFGGGAERVEFLKSEQRAAFIAFAEQYVEEWYVFDFESGTV